nr:MAG TPA: hypothetical protein [Crassvirales sp.]
MLLYPPMYSSLNRQTVFLGFLYSVNRYEVPLDCWITSPVDNYV